MAKTKRRYWLYIIGSMSIAFILGTMLVIPIFNKQEDNIVDYRAEHEKLLGIMGDEPDVDNWWINPTYDPGEIYKPSSFNWTKFWNVFRNHAIWSLQAKHPVTGEWTDANELLTVHRNYTSDNSCKLGLEFTTPDNGQTLDWRFSLAIDYRVKNYVNKSGNYEYTLSYEAWGETFNVTFNWSDMLQYSGLIFKHGITNVDGDDYFWFRVRSNNIPPDYHVYLDPSYTIESGTNIYTAGTYGNRGHVRQSNGTLWVAYYENEDVHITWSEDSGVTWTNDIEIYGSKDSRAPALCVDSNDVVHMVFFSHKNDNDDYQLEYVNSTDWTDIRQMRDEDKSHTYPAIAVDSSDNLFVVYEKGEEGASVDDQVAIMRSLDNGGTWDTEQILTNEATDGDDDWRPSIAIDNNDEIHVVFSCEDYTASGDDDIFHIWSDDTGATFTTWDADMVLEGGHEQRPEIVINDDNDVFVIGGDTSNDVFYRFNMSEDTGWSTIDDAQSEIDLNGAIPTISCSDNNSLYVFYQSSGDIHRQHNFTEDDFTDDGAIIVGTYYSPSTICSQYPIINGYETNRPKTGYAFTYYSTSAIYYHASDDLTWDTHWWNNDWGYRKLITINNSQVDNTLINFPVLVNFSGDSDLADHSQVDKDDIVFIDYKDDTTQFNHEIENAGDDFLDAWVNVTTVNGHCPTRMWMYYGNDSCGSQEHITDTWDSNFVGVWHLHDDYLDSTANDFDCSEDVGDVTDVAVGKVGGADHFDESSRLATGSNLALGAGAFTTEVWYTGSGAGSYDGMAGSTNASGNGIAVLKHSNNFVLYVDGFQDDSGVTVSDSAWHYCAATRAGTSGTFCVDGDITSFTISDGNVDSDKPWYIGDWGAGYYILGDIDEVRVSDIDRSGVWMTATYNTMTNETTFTTKGDEESAGDVPDTVMPTVTINFAGNLSDSGGPYWRPPGISVPLAGVWSDGYYTNSSKQHEDWIYINCTITDLSGMNDSAVWVNWLNETTYTNWTYLLTNRTDGYYDWNSSDIISTMEGYNYSFDIVANDTDGNSNLWQWNKTKGVITPVHTRRYVQLNCTPVGVDYSSSATWYHSNLTTPSIGSGDDLLLHDQAPGGSNDVESIGLTLPDDVVVYTYCTSSIYHLVDESVCTESFTLDNIYSHIWLSLDGTGDFNASSNMSRKDAVNLPVGYTLDDVWHSNLTYDQGAALHNNSYRLETKWWDCEDRDITDNNIYELGINYIGISTYPSIISNRSFVSFYFFNVPSNETLNTTGNGDTDDDKLSDYNELYTYYTHPFLSDTDNDGKTDYEEVNGVALGSWYSDPNNYTNVTEATYFPGTPTQEGENPTDDSTDIDVCPATILLNVTCEDTNGDNMNATWWSDSEGSWEQFASNTTSFTNGSIEQTNSNFSNYDVTYNWSVNLTDGHENWKNETYSFTTESLATSVNTIIPYNTSTSPLTVTATGDNCLDNVTLYYRFNEDNSSTYTEGGGAGASENWYDESGDGTDWSYRRLITINSSKVSDTLTNFPVLVYQTGLDGDNIQDDGDDIFFVSHSDNTTVFKHELENYTDGTGTLWAWVNVTSVSDTEDTKMWMYYGNTTCGSQQDKENVWDSDHRIVQHFNESSGTMYDSTVYDNDGTPSGVSVVTGKVFNAVKGDADSDIVTIADNANWEPGSGSFTVSYWMKLDSNSEAYIVCIDPYSSSQGVQIGLEADNPHFYLNNANPWIHNGGESGSCDSPDMTGDELSWQHWTWVYTPSTSVNLYINGSLFHSCSSDIASSVASATRDMELVSSTNYDKYAMFGLMDEFRWELTGRNRYWLEATYNSTSDPEGFLYFDSEEEYSAGGGSSGNATDWVIWDSTSTNPDTSHAWSWIFNFTGNQTGDTDVDGYYQFYSVGQKDGSSESIPVGDVNDTVCNFTATEFNWLGINNWNITLSNTSIWRGVNLWNITLSNTTIDVWNGINNWNLTISNSSMWKGVNFWNITLSNTTNYPPTFDFEIPVNQSTDIDLTPYVNVTVYNIEGDNEPLTCCVYNSTDGITWYHLSYETECAANYSITPVEYFQAWEYNTKYYWKVTADDETYNVTSDIYEFTTGTIWKGINQWNITLSNTSIWRGINLWNITLSNTTIDVWNGINNWNITLSNSSMWKGVNFWNITISNSSLWKGINLWNVTLSNISNAFKGINEWNITLSNTSVWRGINLWNTTLSNTTLDIWRGINLWNITLSNQSHWLGINNWNVTISNTSLFKGINNWNITISNTTNWKGINQWNITISNVSNLWKGINQWNITLSNTSNWRGINLWNITLSNTTIDVWNGINDWNITLSNQSHWLGINQWNITISNSSLWKGINNWNLTISNVSNLWNGINNWNLTLSNTTGLYKGINYWNITLSNASIWRGVNLWNITLSNTTLDIWRGINDWNLTLSNQSMWIGINNWNLTISNITGLYKGINNWNITISNITFWNGINQWNITLSNITGLYKGINNWNITLSNQSIWKGINTWNITLSNTTIDIWQGINLWNLTLSNQSIWRGVNQWNITISNITGLYKGINTWNITISNTTLWNGINQWNITLSNITGLYKGINNWNITLSNSSMWRGINEWNVTLSNTTIDVWNGINNWNLTLSNQSQWLGINQWNITISNTTAFKGINNWNITISNITGLYKGINTWNITLSNQSNWHGINNWNITLSNTTIDVWNGINQWNITLSNQSHWLGINQWNITISNSTLWKGINNWNITLSNVTGLYKGINSWNITLSNSSNWYTINDWNITLSNTTIDVWNGINLWNITLSNQSIYKGINNWNITLSNVTGLYKGINEWNITLSNVTGLYKGINNWNITISNTTLDIWRGINNWNITLSNTTLNIWQGINQWNITLSNTTIDIWKGINNWNITLSNTTLYKTINQWNITLTNTTIHLITITNIYPNNNSHNIELQPYLYATFNSTLGNNLNITWYYNSNTLGTETNTTNGTYNELLYQATNRATPYHWNVKVNDGMGNWLNTTYKFRTEGYSNNVGYIVPTNALTYLGLFGILAFILVIIILLKKRKKEE